MSNGQQLEPSHSSNALQVPQSTRSNNSGHLRLKVYNTEIVMSDPNMHAHIQYTYMSLCFYSFYNAVACKLKYYQMEQMPP